MRKSKSKAKPKSPLDLVSESTADLLSHVLEDVYVGDARAEQGRTVRMVTHDDSDLVELVSCDESAVQRAKARLVSGSYSVKGLILRRPPDQELAKLMDHHGLTSLPGFGQLVAKPETALSMSSGSKSRARRYWVVFYGEEGAIVAITKRRRLFSEARADFRGWVERRGDAARSATIMRGAADGTGAAVASQRAARQVRARTRWHAVAAV